ncbi:MAG TPA: glycosyltransferase family 4 protein [Thiobacillaceae bacterium]|nr:glycosyltransferase family 4 protein [Thiobacillaceae bacterium]
MKLLFFVYSLTGGGAERATTNLANYWAGNGWDITIVTLASCSLDFYKLHPAIKRIALDLAGDSGSLLAGLTQNLRRVLALRRVLRRIEPDIAIGMMTTANVLLALATWGLPQVRAIGSERTHPPQSSLGMVWEALRRHTYRRLAAVTALTRESAAWLKGHTRAQRLAVIPNAALWPLPWQEPTVRPGAVCPAGRQLLLAAGRLENQKGFVWLLDAFAHLSQKYFDWDLVILGEGPQRALLEGQVRAGGLEKRVFLPGRAGNMGEWYERADLYVMSSHFEGFPNTLAEAMAHGTPAVSFDCDTGPRDIIRDAVDGLLVPPEDLPGLIAALDRVMGDAALRRRYAARAIEARDRFSMERIAGMWEKLFEEALSERR